MLASSILRDETFMIIDRNTQIKEVLKMIEKSKQWKEHQNQSKGLEL